MSPPPRQGPVDTARRCYYANDPASRPDCTLTATVRYGNIALCPSCRAMRSTIGKEQSAIALPTAPALDVLDWLHAAHQQAAATDRSLATMIAAPARPGNPGPRSAPSSGSPAKPLSSASPHQPGPRRRAHPVMSQRRPLRARIDMSHRGQRLGLARWSLRA